jgi:hypothetical protein
MLKGARMTRYLLIAVLLSSSVSRVAAAAPASSSWTDGKFSAAGLIGYGIGFDSANEYGFGFGARGGYTFPFQLYVGPSFIYYVGTSPQNNVTVHTFTLAAEVGYELVVGPAEVRPFLGIGLGNPTVSLGVFASASTAYFAVMPGGVVAYSFNGPLSTGPFVGGDVHLTWLPAAHGANDLSLLATGGYRF